MGKRNLFVKDFDYLFAETDIKDIVSSLIDVTSEFTTLLDEVVVNLEGEIAVELSQLGSSMTTIQASLVNQHDGIDETLQSYLSDVDKIDDFIY